MRLTDQEIAEIRTLIDSGEALPEKYRFALFKEPHEAELIWPGKTHEVTNVVLPFQSIEQIDEPRAETAASGADLFTLDRATGRQSGGWTNKLIWGDNKLVLSSLKNGPLRREIENAGGLKLIYIDPPFDVGGDFSFNVEVGNDVVTKEPSVVEEIAYRDTWGRGRDSYFGMISERLKLIHDLIAADGTIYVHCDWRVNAGIRAILDEIFTEYGFRNEIVWFYENKLGTGWQAKTFDTRHDIIFRFSKSQTFVHNPIVEAVKNQKMQPVTQKIEGKRVWLKNADGSLMYAEGAAERPVGDVWTIPIINPVASERLDYPTQKPEALLDRVIAASSNIGDLVADFFCGSGTALAVAEKLGRKWIGCDLGRFAVHTSRKRLIGVQRELRAEGKPYRSFEILNLGKYERQYFVGIDHTLPEKERAALSAQKEEHYVTLILMAYKAERVFQTPPFHGRKGSTFVVVGPLDAPVTRFQIEEAVEACRKHNASRLDVLGFEFEMGLNPQCVDEAKGKGVSLALRYIPKEVFDKRAVDKNQVVFYDVAYVEVQPVVKGRKVTVKLKDFGVSYRQDDVDALAGEMKAGTKVTVADGQVVKITKDKQGIVKREVLTKKWEDWIDYWAVDFDFTRRPETIVVTLPDATGRMVDRPQRTGGFIFENEWQSFRTRRDRKLELESAPFEYAAKGKYKIAVKVIDIFGNDTTKVVEVSV
jgi:DNA modification methylase